MKPDTTQPTVFDIDRGAKDWLDLNGIDVVN